MTRSVRTSLVSSFSSAILVCSLGAIAACGGDDGTVTVVDAALDAATDAPTDAPPLVCNAPRMVCGGECIDVRSSEQYCGNCSTTCGGGQVCNASTCACPSITIAANPDFFMPQTSNMLPGAVLGIGPMASGVGIDLLVIAHPTTGTVENQAYPLSGTALGTPPFAAYGYDVDTTTFTPAAAFYATSGTLTFTQICAAPDVVGFSGTLTNARFQAVEGLMNPVIVPNGCTIGDPTPIASVSFSFGNVSCTNQ